MCIYTLFVCFLVICQINAFRLAGCIWHFKSSLEEEICGRGPCGSKSTSREPESTVASGDAPQTTPSGMVPYISPARMQVCACSNIHA